MTDGKAPRPPTDPAAETRSVLLKRADALCLVVSTETGVRVLPMYGSELVLGRAKDAGVEIDDASVSRRHARLVVGETGATITDLSSRNGTRVNGVRLSPNDAVDVAIGSSFELGSTTVILQRAAGVVDPKHAPVPQPSHAAASTEPIVHDAAMKRLYALLDVIAPSPLSVLVLGETGVGKEVFADAVHRRSRRSAGRFLKLNCAALPESILEGELFGYERGAFTGAVQSKAGLFESADGGTVFLDEVGELPLGTQAKLLRVLESGEVMRLGARQTTKVDVRFVSATNRDLRARIAAGEFRSDLFFRLNGMSVTIPPLRERRADVMPLAEMLARRAATAMGTKEPRWAVETRAMLEGYGWPGNVRELKNVIDRAVVMAGEGALVSAEVLQVAEPAAFGVRTVDEKGKRDEDAVAQPAARSPATPATYQPAPLPGDATTTTAGGDTLPPPPALRDAAPRPTLEAELRAVERDRITKALEQCAGNQSRAARMLGMSRHTLLRRIEEYGMVRPRKA